MIAADEESFRTLAEGAARCGWTVWRSHPSDGPVCYFAGRWGQVRALSDLGEVKRFLALVGAL